MAQDTITLHLGEITVPLTVVQELLKRHVVRSLKRSTNGHAAPPTTPDPDPEPDPEPEPAPAVAQPAAAGAP